jgi:glycyl-tRNA synthetase
MQENKKNQELLMDKITSLCKRRGFIYQGSEIYGGLAGTYDYGPLGAVLKNNIRDSWLNHFVTSKENMYLIDTPILMHPRVWEASGHTTEFIDPLVDDLVTKKRYRADHLLEDAGVDAEKMTVAEMDQKIKELGLTSPDGNPLSEVRKFNLMLETKLGAVEETAISTYLRPEEAQSMFVNFKNILNSFSPKIPFGIAQIGKAFRNEITPRDFTYRLREFEIMEFEYFIHPNAEWEKLFDMFLDEQRSWLTAIGIPSEKLHALEHPATGRAHYSKKTVDLEFEYPFGIKELTGLAHRGDYDLTQHQKFSGESLEVFDEEAGEKFIPHVLEPTVSIDRTLLALLVASYCEDEKDGEVRTYLKFKPSIAPIVCAVSPLLKNKPELVAKAREVFSILKEKFGRVMWDDNGNIGKRYRRQDEIGTPWCIVVDFDTLGEGGDTLRDTVTVRDRDSGQQTRVAINELVNLLASNLK